MSLQHEDVREILRLLDASPFDEMHLETDGFKLTVRRSNGSDLRPLPKLAAAPPAAPATQADPAPTAQAAPPPPKPAPAAEASGEYVEIPAPMLGTFYRSPKPGAAPFIEVGTKLESDTVIGIIEVMKLMTSVAAGITGEVVEICADDGQLVEYGQVLVRVKPEAT